MRRVPSGNESPNFGIVQYIVIPRRLGLDGSRAPRQNSTRRCQRLRRARAFRPASSLTKPMTPSARLGSAAILEASCSITRSTFRRNSLPIPRRTPRVNDAHAAGLLWLLDAQSAPNVGRQDPAACNVCPVGDVLLGACKKRAHSERHRSGNPANPVSNSLLMHDVIEGQSIVNCGNY
jgi:hypothetical protein